MPIVRNLSASCCFDHAKSIIARLEDTLRKYEKSCQPVLSKEEYVGTQEAIRTFLTDGLGDKLQQRLQLYDAQQKASYIEDIWLQKAYLEYRDPILINSNWWCEFADHPDQPETLIRKPPPEGVLTTFQIQRAAGLISNLLKFKSILDRDVPLCMNQYRSQFGAARVPGEKTDTLFTQHPAEAKHIIVTTKDQLYVVDVLKPNGASVSIAELERLLYTVSKDSAESTPEPAIGRFTSGSRTTWAKAYDTLRTLSTDNSKNFDIINNALFVVCLDDHSTIANKNQSHKQIFHNFDGRNRWFDKSIQLVVASSGRAGMNGEHTPADAVTPGTIIDFILKNEPATDADLPTDSSPPLAPRKLRWTVDGTILDLLQKAEKEAKAVIKSTESILLQTDIYGSRYMKEVAKVSPDTYVQMALQLTWQRMHKVPTAIYESVSTRKFLHGRTETGRCLSTESLAFADSFDNDNVLYDTKRKLLARAVQAHSTYLKEAANGRGIDRHLLALRCMMNEEERHLPSIFTDVGFQKSADFRLSTSNMSPGTRFYGGFGPVAFNGYGVNYAIDKDALKFSISWKQTCKETNGYDFRSTLERTLADMMILFPKRSQVWGPNWSMELKQERKEERNMQMMSDLSEDYMRKKKQIEGKYVDQIQNPPPKSGE
ncbi:hypothetical protein HK102_005995 [Quaeritorhiza haematococci]|nr:hypothetical protein HK102_005995 [Quaeritorhiza haematococci]